MAANAAGIPGYETTRQAADRLGIDPSQVRRYCEQGRIPGAAKVAKTWLIPEGSLPETKALGRPPTWEEVAKA